MQRQIRKARAQSATRLRLLCEMHHPFRVGVKKSGNVNDVPLIGAQPRRGSFRPAGTASDCREVNVGGR